MTSQAPTSPSRWPRWVQFAETAMLAIGIIQIVNGIVALLRSDIMLLPGGMSVHVDYKAVGWIFVALGALMLVAGIAVMSGRGWTRAAGIGAAVLSLLCNLILFWSYPLWTGIVIVLDIAVVYALTAHGKQAQLYR